MFVKKKAKKIIIGESIERIIMASIDCVSLYGYEGASTEKIANLANVSKALIHYHFKTKEDLLIHSFNYFAKEISEEVKQKIQNYQPSIQTTILAANQLLESLILNQKRAYFFVEMYSTAIHNKKFRKKLQKYHLLEEKLIEDVIHQCLYSVKQKLLIPIEKLAKIFQTIMIGLAVQSAINLNKEEIQERFDDLMQILISVILKT